MSAVSILMRRTFLFALRLRGAQTLALEEDGMADDNQLAKTLQQYLADPRLLTDENVRRFSRSLRDRGAGG